MGVIKKIESLIKDGNIKEAQQMCDEWELDIKKVKKYMNQDDIKPKAKRRDNMQLLTKETETQIASNIVNECKDMLFKVLEEEYSKFPYIQQKDLLQELGINYKTLKQFEAHGLKKVKADPNSRIVFYKRSEVVALMDKLAE